MRRMGRDMSTTGKLRGGALLMALLVSASVAPAAFNYTLQTRSVHGDAGGSLGSATPQTISATNFGVFDATTNVTVPTYGGSANQHQHSELLPTSIIVTGDTNVFRPAEVGTGIANTETITDVTFTISVTTQVAL